MIYYFIIWEQELKPNATDLSQNRLKYLILMGSPKSIIVSNDFESKLNFACLISLTARQDT